MICAITGELRRVEEDRVQLACGDVIYEILVPAFDLSELSGEVGQPVMLHTIFDLEGDATRGGLAPRLIGFLRNTDKKFFQAFITVKGIGPKRALRALVRPVGQIAAAIESKNTRFLLDLPEIGRRTAEQIVAELAGKLQIFATDHAVAGAPAATAHNTMDRSAIEAAIKLGISRQESERLLERAKLAEPGPQTEDAMLREMLRLRTIRV